MYPILTRYGPFFLYSYTVVMGVGLLGAVWLARRQGGKVAVPSFLIVLFAALFGGRLGFLLLNAPYFAAEPASRWQLWGGGFLYIGALSGGLVALPLLVWRRRAAGLPAALALPLLWMHAAGWFACYLEGCGYGRVTTLHPLAADLPDTLGVFALRYQTQLGGTAVYLLLLLLGWRLLPRLPAAAHFWGTLLLVALVESALTFWRGDLPGTPGLLPLTRWFLAGFAILSLLLIQFHYWRGNGRQMQPDEPDKQTLL